MFEGRFNHGTFLGPLYWIWKDKELSPQQYRGGDSILPSGTEVVFCFKFPRTFSMAEYLIILPEDSKPDGEGNIIRRADYHDAMYSNYRLEDFTEPEYWFFHSFPLKDLIVYRRCRDIPTTEEISEDLYENGCDCRYIYSPKVIKEISQFRKWIINLPVWNDNFGVYYRKEVN